MYAWQVGLEPVTHQVRTSVGQFRGKSELEGKDVGVRGKAKRKAEITVEEWGQREENVALSDPSKTPVVEE